MGIDFNAVMCPREKLGCVALCGAMRRFFDFVSVL